MTHKYIIIGLGNIGKKRKEILKEKCVASVDPFVKADFKDYRSVPLGKYDCAVLATPNNVKLCMVEWLLEHGKNVLIEKPFLMNSGELDKLRDLAKESGAVWYTAYNHRFEPTIVELKSIVDSGRLGKLYFGEFVYGNGTAKNIVDTWRDTEYGVLEDLGCHLMDLAKYIFGHEMGFDGIGNMACETHGWDYCSFRGAGLMFTCSYLMWKNTFRVELYGSKGSIHLDGLKKWGWSNLTLRERVYPSGAPRESISSTTGYDDSWARDIDKFERMIESGENSGENDLYISDSIRLIVGI